MATDKAKLARNRLRGHVSEEDLAGNVMVQARTYFAPVNSLEASPDFVSVMNYSLNLGFKIVLAVSIVKLLWDIWRAIVSARKG